jgi:hypothetical protein
MSDAAKISIQLGAMSLSAEGSEAFVRDAIQLWDRLSASAPTEHRTPAGAHTADDAGGSMITNRAPGGASSAAAEYENVFDRVDGKLKVIAHVPGSTKADKTRNVALVVLYGHYLNGEEQIPSELIRETCSDQGCFDPTNFAQYLKGLKEKVAMNTKPGGGYDVKLTAPGRKAARELVETLDRAVA